MKSVRTKQCRNRKNLFSLLHLLCLFGPFLYFIPYAYITGETVEKLCMSFTIIFSLILAFMSLIVGVKAKAGLQRTILWALLAGVLFCLQEVKVFIWIMCLASIIDELVFSRLKDYYKTAFISNKEIDKRE